MKSLDELILEAASSVTRYSAEEAVDRRNDSNVLFVDVRDVDEIARFGTIPGAVHASRGMLEFYLDRESPYFNPVLARERELVFFCKSGSRSVLAAQTARDRGVRRVASIDGGIEAWKAAGGPVDRSQYLVPIRHSELADIP